MGDLICGEVSSINDDNVDNYNAEDVNRFSTVEEDEAILHPLCNEYSGVL
jgi:D-lyxose ketol-isomerase